MCSSCSPAIQWVATSFHTADTTVVLIFNKNYGSVLSWERGLSADGLFFCCLDSTKVLPCSAADPAKRKYRLGSIPTPRNGSSWSTMLFPRPFPQQKQNKKQNNSNIFIWQGLPNSVIVYGLIFSVFTDIALNMCFSLFS